WVAILTAIGYIAGQNRALIEQYSKKATLWVLVGCAAIIALYVVMYRRRKARPASTVA
ncbi:MAG: DedA family protein, partial [Lentisphaerae bacterium]|nr:DedA family protein [Lentisphaerota bacterium]